MAQDYTYVRIYGCSAGVGGADVHDAGERGRLTDILESREVSERAQDAQDSRAVGGGGGAILCVS